MVNQNALKKVRETSFGPQNLHLNKIFTVQINVLILLVSKKPNTKTVNVDL